MQLANWSNSVDTPAFVYDEAGVGRALAIAEALRAATGCRVLYSVKPLCLPPLLELLAPRLDGFAVSSPFEARLAHSVLSQLGPSAGGHSAGSIHFTSPGIRPGEAGELADLCGYVSFNSLSQWRRHRADFQGRAQCGLRVNPGLSFLEDERYDPCREFSKLGVPLESLAGRGAEDNSPPEGLDGLLVHSNCESTDFTEMERTVDRLCDAIPGLLGRVKWINLGGGYVFRDADGLATDLAPLHRIIRRLQRDYGLTVFLEPGAAFVRSAGYIVASVLDIFPSGGKEVAILDTTVNHMPEILEFDFEPDVTGHQDDGPWEYLLAGCTCLAGDLFGEYRFGQPLAVGDRIIFCNAGSYTLVKAHTFNGVNLPAVYALNGRGELSPVRQFGYADFAARWGAYAGSPV